MNAPRRITYGEAWNGRGEPRPEIRENGRGVATFADESERAQWARVEYGDDAAEALAANGETTL